MATDYQTRIDDLRENAKIDSEALRKGLDKIRDDYEVTLKQLEYYYNRKKKSNNEMLEAFAAKLEKLEDERRDLVMQRLDEANLKLVKENSVVEEEKEVGIEKRELYGRFFLKNDAIILYMMPIKVRMMPILAK